MLTNFMSLPAVESLAEGLAINFYKTVADQDLYCDTGRIQELSDNYFYARTKFQLHSRNGILKIGAVKGDIDKDVYFVSKSDNTELEKYQDIQKIRSEGGLFFFFFFFFFMWEIRKRLMCLTIRS